MSFSYTGNPKDSTVNEIRFIVGDTNKANYLLEDEEIQYMIDKYTDVNQAIYEILQNMLNKVASEVSEKLGPQEVKNNEKFMNYKELANFYRKQINSSLSPPWFKEPHDTIFDIGMLENDR